MLRRFLKTNDFRQLLRRSLERRVNLRTIRVASHQPVYVGGETAETVYFIESGQIKLLMLSPEGKECLLAIHTAGDIFGELCLVGLRSRLEAAIAMKETVLKSIPGQAFLDCLDSDSLLEGFARHLATRISEQQRIIATLLTVDSEHRLGETLLLLARKLGKGDIRSTRANSNNVSPNRCSLSTGRN